MVLLVNLVILFLTSVSGQDQKIRGEDYKAGCCKCDKDCALKCRTEDTCEELGCQGFVQSAKCVFDHDEKGECYCRKVMCRNPNPCQNMGECISISEVQDGSDGCNCKPGYTGVFCELEIVDCVASLSDWTACNVTCGLGSQQRTHTITTPAKNGGQDCPLKDGEMLFRPCQQPDCVNGACTTGSCICNTGFTGSLCEIPIVDCVGSWSTFSTCNTTCGNGTQVRTYTITTEVSGGGIECPFSAGATESRICVMPSCQNSKPCVDGSCNCGSDFTGTLCETALAPPKDCIAVDSGFKVLGTQCGIGATSKEIVGAVETTSRENITVSLCNSGAEFDTKISIFKTSSSQNANACGPNNACTCEAQNDDGCGPGSSLSQVTFTAESSTYYEIVVHGSGDVREDEVDMQLICNNCDCLLTF